MNKVYVRWDGAMPVKWVVASNLYEALIWLFGVGIRAEDIDFRWPGESWKTDIGAKLTTGSNVILLGKAAEFWGVEAEIDNLTRGLTQRSPKTSFLPETRYDSGLYIALSKPKTASRNQPETI